MTYTHRVPRARQAKPNKPVEDRMKAQLIGYIKLMNNKKEITMELREKLNARITELNQILDTRELDDETTEEIRQEIVQIIGLISPDLIRINEYDFDNPYDYDKRKNYD